MLLQSPDVVVAVLIAVNSASVVSNPDVVATLRQLTDNRWCEWIEAAKPRRTSLASAMLDENGRSAVILNGLTFDLSDTEGGQEPSITSFHDMRLPPIAELVTLVRPHLILLPLFRRLRCQACC